MGVWGDKNDSSWSENLFGLLAGQIERGELAAGQSMTSWTLAREYGIKPEVAAKALKALEDFGFVDRGPEYGEYYVCAELPPR